MKRRTIETTRICDKAESMTYVILDKIFAATDGRNNNDGPFLLENEKDNFSRKNEDRPGPGTPQQILLLHLPLCCAMLFSISDIGRGKVLLHRCPHQLDPK